MFDTYGLGRRSRPSSWLTKLSPNKINSYRVFVLSWQQVRGRLIILGNCLKYVSHTQNLKLNWVQENLLTPMPRKVNTEPVRALTVELPQSEFEALERYCLQRQETKKQVIRTLLRKAIKKVTNE